MPKKSQPQSSAITGSDANALFDRVVDILDGLEKRYRTGSEFGERRKFYALDENQAARTRMPWSSSDFPSRIVWSKAT